MTELTVALSWVESQHPATVGPLSHSVILPITLFLNNRVISHTIYFTFGTLKPNDVHFDILIKIKVTIDNITQHNNPDESFETRKSRLSFEKMGMGIVTMPEILSINRAKHIILPCVGHIWFLTWANYWV